MSKLYSHRIGRRGIEYPNNRIISYNAWTGKESACIFKRCFRSRNTLLHGNWPSLLSTKQTSADIVYTWGSIDIGEASSNISDCVRRLCLLVTRAPHPFEYFNRELQRGLEVSRFAGGINKVRRPRCSMLYIAYPPFHLLRLSGILGSSLVSIVFFHVLPSVLLVICSFPAGPPYTGQQISVIASSFSSVDYHISSPILPRDIL